MNAAASSPIDKANVAERLYRRRNIVNRIAIVMSCVAAVFGLFFLAWILWTTISKGLGGISIAPGPIFSASRGFAHCLRLNYGQEWNARSEAALATLGRLAHAL